LLFLSGVVLCAIAQIFLTPMLKFFGSPENVLGYAKTYTRYISIGFPFLIFATGGGHLIRADGSPKYTMICNLSGAVINTILDPIFIFGFNMGMAGAGLSTIIGQIFSAYLAFRYFRRYKTGKIEKKHLKLKGEYIGKITSLGAAPCFNQLAMMVVQIVMNKSLTYYGALSVYGESIPLACAGIITKVNQIYMSVVIGLSQGLQPIASFNYGAKKYDRVKKIYLLALRYGLIISVIAFSIFLIFNSYYRMFLYIGRFRFTNLRLQVILFLFMEIILFGFIIKKILRGAKKDGMVFLIIMTITYVINLYVCNDWFIGILEKIWK
jgi:Na+-driven multidrug efflux pump